MSGAERRAAILTAAMRVFSAGSYASATTAAIAREAGITEPVLYHHFKGKADLYSACLDLAWLEIHTRWEEALDAEPDPARWLPLMAVVGFAHDDEREGGRMWLHAITDIADDPRARPRVVTFTRDLHEYIAGVLARAQEAGGVRAELDPRAEAWIFLGIGALRALSRRLDGVADADFPSVLASRHAWYGLEGN